MNEFMECLADNGIEAGWDLPLPPPERGIDMAVTRRALTTCQQFYPKTQTS